MDATCRFVFSLWDAGAGGAQQGPTLTYDGVGGNPAPLVLVGGLFTTTPPLDFGSQWNGDARFLDVQASCGTDPAYTSLGRQALLSTPYSISTASLQGRPLSQAAPAGNDVLRWNGAAWAPVTSDLAGDVTGPPTATQIAAGVVGSTEIANLSIQDEDIANVDAGKLTTGTLPDARLSSSVVRGSGTVNYHPKFTAAATLGNSLILDNGTSLGFNAAPSTLYLGYFSRTQLTAAGDGQATLYGYRTRDSQNDGTAYSQDAANSATEGYNFWGDRYTFGVGGWNYNDYDRTGGTFGADVNGIYWGSLGYRASSLLNYGVYGSSAYASGAGFPGTQDKQGIGGGFYGGMIGSWSQGEVMGQVSSGALFASYNVGNVYTSGYSADVVAVSAESGAPRVAAYAVTSPELKVYDNGSARLEGASVFVPFSSSYAGMLLSVPDVTVSPVGSPAQLYIQSIGKEGFTVAVAAGTASVKFSWIAVGTRADAGKAALPAELADGSFDARLKRVMFNEGDRDGAGQPIWWDGQAVRFDEAPRPAAPAKKEGR